MDYQSGFEVKQATQSRISALSGRNFAKLLLVSGSMLAWPMSNAMAQEAVNDVPQAGQLNEIVVTAQKREQSAQDIPIAITAISGAELVSAGVQSSNDIADLTPGLKISPVFGAGNIPNLAIRGVGLNDFRDYNESPSAVYVDEVYKGALASLDFQLFDVDRVEVLKGPQGTLFGRNATGGLIHYITKKPTDEADGFLRIGGGSFGDVNVEGAIGGPLGDQVSARISAIYHKNNGIQQNQNPAAGARDGNDVNLAAVRAQFKINIGERATLLLTGEGSSNDNKGGNPYRYAPSSFNANGLAQIDRANRDIVVGTSDLNDINVSPGLFLKANYTAATARLEVDLGGVELIAISNGQNFKKRAEQDCDSAPAVFCITRYGAHTKQFSQELRLQGGSGALNWSIGGYYFDLNTDGTQTLTGPVTPLLFQDPSATITTTAFDTTTKSYAAFGQIEYSFTDSLSFNGGLRYTNDKKDISQTFLLGYVPGGITYDSTTVGPLAKQNDDNVSYLAKVVWKSSSDFLVYVGTSSGYKAGTFNSGFGPVAPANYLVKPEKLTSYEAGFKAEFGDRRHRVNGAVFHYDYKDSQAFVFQGLNQLLFNADAKYNGAEFEYTGLLTDSFMVNAGVAWLDTKVKNVQDRSGAIYDRKAVLAPEISANAMARYTADLGGSGKLAFQLDGSYSSSVYFDNINQPGLKEGGYALLNGRISWKSESGSLEVAAFVRNITDKVNRIYAFDLTGDLGYVQESYRTPRTFGASATINF